MSEVNKFSSMCLDILNNEVDDDVADLLRQCKLVAIGKGDDGVRPIAMGEALVRLAGKLGMSAVAPEIEAMSDLQYAFVEGGCDRIVHWARSEYRKPLNL